MRLHRSIPLWALWPMSCLASLACVHGAARGQELTVDEIMWRTQKVMAPRERAIVCGTTLSTEVHGSSGKTEESERREGEMTLVGDAQELRTTRLWRNGKEIPVDQKDEKTHSAVEIKNAEKNKTDVKNKNKKESISISIDPLAERNFPNQTFTLLRRDTLWGHPVYVVQVRAARPSAELAAGTLYIDAERFVQLKGELTPAKLPKMVDWMTTQMQYALDGRGQVVPSALHVSGGGHFLFLRKSMFMSIRWNDCHDHS